MKKLRGLFTLLLIGVIFSLSACSSGNENVDDGDNIDYPTLSRGSSIILKYSGDEGYTWDKSEISSKLASLGVTTVGNDAPLLIIGEADHPLYQIGRAHV